MKKLFIIGMLLIAILPLFGEDSGRVKAYFDDAKNPKSLILEFDLSYAQVQWNVNAERDHNISTKEIDIKSSKAWINNKAFKNVRDKKVIRTIMNGKYLKKTLKKAEKKSVIIHFSWMLIDTKGNKYYSLVDRSVYACQGNKTNPDYHFELKIVWDESKKIFKIIPYNYKK